MNQLSSYMTHLPSVFVIFQFHCCQGWQRFQNQRCSLSFAVASPKDEETSVEIAMSPPQSKLSFVKKLNLRKIEGQKLTGLVHLDAYEKEKKCEKMHVWISSIRMCSMMCLMHLSMNVKLILDFTMFMTKNYSDVQITLFFSRLCFLSHQLWS